MFTMQQEVLTICKSMDPSEDDILMSSLYQALSARFRHLSLSPTCNSTPTTSCQKHRTPSLNTFIDMVTAQAQRASQDEAIALFHAAAYVDNGFATRKFKFISSDTGIEHTLTSLFCRCDASHYIIPSSLNPIRARIQSSILPIISYLGCMLASTRLQELSR